MQMSDESLVKMAEEMNAKYKLNIDPEVLDRLDMCYAQLVEGAIASLGFHKVDGPAGILLSIKLQSAPMYAKKTALWHELCHVKTWDEPEEHGPRFIACVKKRPLQGLYAWWMGDKYAC